MYTNCATSILGLREKILMEGYQAIGITISFVTYNLNGVNLCTLFTTIQQLRYIMPQRNPAAALIHEFKGLLQCCDSIIILDEYCYNCRPAFPCILSSILPGQNRIILTIIILIIIFYRSTVISMQKVKDTYLLTIKPAKNVHLQLTYEEITHNNTHYAHSYIYCLVFSVDDRTHCQNVCQW